MDSNRVDRLVEKNGLGVEPRRLESPMKQGEFRLIMQVSPLARHKAVTSLIVH